MAATEAIKVGSCTLLGFTVFVFLIRQFTKATVFRKFAVDDIFILVATILAAGLCLTTFVFASQGLGTSRTLSPKDTNILLKIYYAFQFLYISVICLAKLSLLVLIYNIVASHRLHRRTVMCFAILILTWTIGSLLATAFQCGLPRPWLTSNPKCLNSRIVWIVYCAVDIATEVAVILLAINLVAFLRLRLARKLAVIACFVPRVLVIGAAFAHFIWLYPGSSFSDPQYKFWLPALIMQIQMCLSICTASIPFVVPYFKSLESSLRRSHMVKGRDMEAVPPRPRSFACFRRERDRDLLISLDSAERSEQNVTLTQGFPHISSPKLLNGSSHPIVNNAPRIPMRERGLSLRIPDLHSWRQRPTEIDTSQSRDSLGASLRTPPITPLSRLPNRVPSFRRKEALLCSPSSSRYSDDSVRPSTPERCRFHLSAPRQLNLYRSAPRQDAFAQPGISPAYAPRSQNMAPAASHALGLAPLKAQDYSSSHAKGLRLDPAPRQGPPSALSSLRSKTKGRTALAKDLESPMWEAINDYFCTEKEPSSATSPTHHARTHEAHGRHAWSPSESVSVGNRIGTMSPVQRNALGNEWCLQRDSDTFHQNGSKIVPSKTSRNVQAVPLHRKPLYRPPYPI